jgi:uncharacterized protein YkwD
MKRFGSLFLLVLFTVLPALLLFQSSQAQSNVVGFLRVGDTGVELQRANTDVWVPINVESVVGAGDGVRTTSEGTASIHFLGSDLTIELNPDTSLVIKQAVSNSDSYQIAVEIVSGQTRQVLAASPNPDSTFEFISPVMSVILEEGEVEIHVGDDGTTDVLTTKGMASSESDGVVIEVEEGFGVRQDASGYVSAVLPVSNFDQLDSAIAGLSGTFSTEADVLLNVRQGPSRDNIVIGTLAPDSIDTIMGISADGTWYRVPFLDSYGWISGTGLTVDVDDTRLVVFAADFVESPPSVQAEAKPVTAEDVSSEPAVSEEEAIANQLPSVFTEYSQEELNLIAAMNEWRLSEGVVPFQPNPVLTRMARDQAEYLISLPSLPNDLHVDSKGRHPRERAISDEYLWPYYSTEARTNIGENGYVGASVDVAITWWSSSETHTRAAMNSGYREIGVAAVPHPWGFIYLTVFGSRPDTFPIAIDSDNNTLYVPSEEYRFASGGDWLHTVEEIQFIDSVEADLDSDAWIPYASTIDLPRDGTYAVALRGNGKTVIAEVDTVEDILIVPDVLPDEPVSSTALSAQEVETNTWDFLFPTNTPAP